MEKSSSQLIPKRIHYCWFGKGKKPQIVKKCIRSWEKKCPDYEIIEWNESNFDINCNKWCQLAYEEKKWAFVSDYVRLKVLWEYGGIYMDTDVELLKPLDDFLVYKCFLGFQHETFVSNGLIIGAEKNHVFVKENMEIYENLVFRNEKDSYKLKVCQEYTTEILQNKGLIVPCDGKIQIVRDVYVFPPDYFCPYDHRTNTMHQTKNTVSIHHFASSWWDNKRKKEYKKIKRTMQMDYLLHTPNRILIKIMGEDSYNQLKKKVRGVYMK